MKALKKFEQKLIVEKTVLIIDGKTIGCVTKLEATKKYFLKVAT